MTPPGYAVARVADGTWIVMREVAEALPLDALSALLRGRARRADGPVRGRGGVALIDLGGRLGVGKRALHGGLMGRFLGGVFWGTRRCRRPIDLALRLRLAGVPTPDVLAAGWRRMVGPLHAIALVTEAVPCAINVHEALLERWSGTRLRALYWATADTVRSMHDAGFVHADLNLANLVLEDAPGSVRAHVVDLDRGRFVAGLSRRDRLRNLSRLLRSYEKWVAPTRPLGIRDGVAFLERYCRGDRSMVRDFMARLGRSRSRLWLRRLIWRRRHTGGDARGLVRPAQQR